MPWRSEDAKRHIKGLTSRQARIWARVANDALKRCMDNGGSQKECEGRAIRQANAAAKRVGTKNNVLQTVSLTIHEASDLIRYEEFEGKTYLIAPCVSIVEGVLNNAYVSAEEIGKYVETWADVPLPINHPMQDGFPISAKTPAVLSQSVIGRFQNPAFDGKRLTGELWIDLEKAEKSEDGLEIVQRLEAGKSLEISPAFYADFDATPGSFHNQPYRGQHYNIRPDHVALLPHDIGACNWDDGCGAPRINCATCKGACMQHHESDPLVKRFAAFFAGLFKAAESIEDDETESDTLQTHLTDNDIRSALQAELRRAKEKESGRSDMYFDCYVMDVEDEHVIYSEHGKTYRQPFSIDDENRVTLAGDVVEVQQDTRYIPVANAARAGATRDEPPPTREGAETVDKTPVINALIGSEKNTWQEKDRPLLETLDHAVLVRMQEEIDARPAEEPDEDDAQEQDDATAEPEQPTVATQAPQPLTPESITQMVIQAVQTAMDARLETFGQQISERQERQQIMAQLTTHGWTETELTSMPLTALRKLVATVAPANFMGMGLPAFATQAQDDGPSDDPDWT